MFFNFGKNRSSGGAVVTHFPEVLRSAYLSRILGDEIAQKFIYKVYIIKSKNDAIWVHIGQ